MAELLEIRELNTSTGASELRKSAASTIRVNVRFVNCSRRAADILWIDYQGRGIRYITLRRGRHFDVATFEGHPWIFRDSANGDELLCCSPTMTRSNVYNPKIVEHVGTRCLIRIVDKVLSLRLQAISAIGERLHSLRRTSDDIGTLPLPAYMIDCINAYTHRIRRYRSIIMDPTRQHNPLFEQQQLQQHQLLQLLHHQQHQLHQQLSLITADQQAQLSPIEQQILVQQRQQLVAHQLQLDQHMVLQHNQTLQQHQLQQLLRQHQLIQLQHRQYLQRPLQLLLQQPPNHDAQ